MIHFWATLVHFRQILSKVLFQEEHLDTAPECSNIEVDVAGDVVVLHNVLGVVAAAVVAANCWQCCPGRKLPLNSIDEGDEQQQQQQELRLPPNPWHD